MRSRSRTLCLLSGTLLAAVAACGGSSGAGGGGGGGDGGVGTSGDGGSTITECSDGIDNDGDGFVDGFDPECTGAADDDEGSFATGIPGDNIDDKKQDCFFDGNSGGGDDGCAIHTCCLLDDCPPDLAKSFNPDDCQVTQGCIDYCTPLTPPGCDCFGCCTVCDDQGCRDIYTHPAVAPDCDQDTLWDEEKCPSCTKNPDCGPGDDCANQECQLCPGETLPPECDSPECPAGVTPCTGDGDCLDGQYCANGCCINVIQ